jgi:hypothetical protein
MTKPADELSAEELESLRAELKQAAAEARRATLREFGLAAVAYATFVRTAVFVILFVAVGIKTLGGVAMAPIVSKFAVKTLGAAAAALVARWRRGRLRRRLLEFSSGTLCILCDGRDLFREGEHVTCRACGHVQPLSEFRPNSKLSRDLNKMIGYTEPRGDDD